MKRCPFCGSDIPDQALICRFCGEQLERPGQEFGHGAKAQSSSQTVTLIMGILGFLCFPFGIVAIILWASHRSKVKRGLARPDSSATAGMVLGLIGLALNIMFAVGFIILWLTMWGFFNETFAATQLLEIHKAQERYQRAHGEFASELSQLRSYGVQSIEEVSNWFGYRFELRSSGSEWSCTASPVEPGEGSGSLPYLYIDQNGVVRQSDTEDVGPESPEYHLPGTPGGSNPFRRG